MQWLAKIASLKPQSLTPTPQRAKNLGFGHLPQQNSQSLLGSFEINPGISMRAPILRAGGSSIHLQGLHVPCAPSLGSSWQAGAPGASAPVAGTICAGPTIEGSGELAEERERGKPRRESRSSCRRTALDLARARAMPLLHASPAEQSGRPSAQRCCGQRRPIPAQHTSHSGNCRVGSSPRSWPSSPPSCPSSIGLPTPRESGWLMRHQFIDKATFAKWGVSPELPPPGPETRIGAL